MLESIVVQATGDRRQTVTYRLLDVFSAALTGPRPV